MDELLQKKLKSFLIVQLRRASYKWIPRNQAMSKARIKRGLYKCASCAGEFKRHDIQIDHIIPIVPLTGWDNWDGFIARLFCDETGFQCLCKECHSIKSQGENQQRKEERRLKREDMAEEGKKGRKRKP